MNYSILTSTRSRARRLMNTNCFYWCQVDFQKGKTDTGSEHCVGVVTLRQFKWVYGHTLKATKVKINSVDVYKYLIIMTRDSSSCKTLSRYIISRSDTIAPLITIISSPLIIPDRKMKKTVLGMIVLIFFTPGFLVHKVDYVFPILLRADVI